MPEENFKKEDTSTISEVSSKRKLSTGAKIGIGIGICSCVVILIILIVIILTATNQAKKNAQESKYANELTNIVNEITVNMNDLKQNMDEASKKAPNFDNNDINYAEAIYQKVNQNYEKLIKMDVPENYKDIHSLLERGIKYYLDGIMIYKNGLESKNEKDFEKASNLFKKGQEELQKAQEKLK